MVSDNDRPGRSRRFSAIGKIATVFHATKRPTTASNASLSPSEDAMASFPGDTLPLETSMVIRPLLQRAESTDSEITIVGDEPRSFSLAEFCELVAVSDSLQHADILTTEGWTEQIGAITHRFLILRIQRSNRKLVWLRLDRRANKSAIQLLGARGRVPSADYAQLGSSKSILIGPAARRENRQVFTTVPTLGELQHLLQVIVQNLTEYTVWPANCWFFCSLIQQHLEGANKGRFVAGSLPKADMARAIRRNIAEQLRLFYHMPVPFLLSEFIKELQKLDSHGVVRSLSRAHELSVMWDSSPESNANQRQKLARILGESLHETAVQLHRYNRGLIETGVLWKHVVLLFQDLHSGNTEGNKADLVGALLNYGRFLYDVGRIDELQVVSLEARQLSSEDPSIPTSLSNLAENVFTLSTVCSRRPHAQGDPRGFEWRTCNFGALHVVRSDNSYLSLADEIAEKRQLFAEDPERHRIALADALHQYGTSLHKAQLAEAACIAHKECVTHRRELARRDPEMHSADFAASLQSYSNALRLAERVEEACIPAKEAVERYRAIGRQDAEHRARLASALHAFSLCLYAAHKAGDAHLVDQEAITLLRSLCSMDNRSMKQYSPHLASSLNNYSLIRYQAGLEAGDVAEALRHFGEACNAIAEAVRIRRQLWEQEPEKYRSDLASSLTQQCVSLIKIKRYEEACASGDEAVTLRRQVYETDRERHRAEYISTLGYSADALLAASHLQEACARQYKIVDLYRGLNQREPELYRLEFAHWLRYYAKTLWRSQRDGDAQAAEEEAAALTS